MVVRVCEDIVKLLHQKNLINEYFGKKFVKVGEIEKLVGYKMRVTRQPVDDGRYFERKLESEIVDGEAIIAMSEADQVKNDQICEQMIIWLSET